MAKEAKAPVESGEGAAPAGSKKKKLLIIVAAVVLLLALAGAGGAYFLLKGHHADDEGEDGGEVAAEKAKPEKKKAGKEAVPVYVALEPFTVNLVPETGDQFLQLVTSVEVADAVVGEKLKAYTPKLRNNIMLLLSGKKASELLPKEGKEALSGEIRTLMNQVLEPGTKDPAAGPVKEVLFTSFIIQ